MRDWVNICIYICLILLNFDRKRVLNMIITKGYEKKYEQSVTLQEIAEEHQHSYEHKIVAARLDNVIRDLQTPVGNYQTIEFIDMSSEDGLNIYRRSVVFLLITAVHELYPSAEVVVKFSANKGLYCDISLAGGLNEEVVKKIEDCMRQIVIENRPIKKKSLPREEAVRIFKESQQIEKANLITALSQERVSIYYCGEFYDYLYGAMLGSTACLGCFALDYYAPGILIRTPQKDNPEVVPDSSNQAKFTTVLAESKEWAAILHCDYVPDLNRHNKMGDIGDIIRVSEALQEKKIAQIADHITQDIDTLRLILIAGPSSSGKTSFAQRLRIQLRVNGIKPVSISLDDYFCDREQTPKNEKGEYDFEALAALDVDLFNKHLVELLKGREATLPRYNFVTGKREWEGNVPISLGRKQPIIIEGIHGLNEKLTASIPREKKYKIYISALTQLNIDAHNRIPTTDARLLRRIVRDYQTRASSALKTLRQWPDVRAGEEKNIFPFQEEADVMFNSALIYEVGILKKYVTPLLEKITPEEPEYTKAIRLLDFCRYFDDIYAEDDIPNNSILREFIGKSCFFN